MVSVAADACEVLLVFLEGGHRGFIAGEALFFDFAEALEHPLVVAWKNFEELGKQIIAFSSINFYPLNHILNLKKQSAKILLISIMICYK